MWNCQMLELGRADVAVRKVVRMTVTVTAVEEKGMIRVFVQPPGPASRR